MRIAVFLSAAALQFMSLNAIAQPGGIDPRSATDPSSDVRGSLGAPLEDLDVTREFGRLTFLLNGGSLLLAGALVVLGGRRHRSRSRREPARIAVPTP